MIDLLDYLRGDGRLYELINNWNSYEIVQTQTEPNNVFYHVKNSQWEELWADDVFIYRGTDTSPGNNEIYMLSENSHYGSAWVPRWFEVGQTFKRSATVIWRAKSNGASIPSKPTAVAVTYIRLERVYTTLTFDSGIQLSDVAELNAYVQDGDHAAATPWEKYFYAKGFGLVAFQDMYGGFHSWISQKFTPETMPQRVRETISWLTPLQKRYYLPALPATTASGAYIASQMNAAFVNVRAYPNLYGKDIGDLNKGETVTLFTPEVDGWIKLEKAGLAGWVSYQNGTVAFTPTTGTPTPTPDPGSGLPTVKPLGKYTLTALPASWVNIRDYPNASGHDIGDLHKGDVVTLYTPDVDGWVYLDTGTAQGWVWRQNGKVTFTVVPDNNPIPPDDLPPLPDIKPTGQYTLSKLPGTWVNVRAYPDTVGADVGDLHKGDVVTLYTPEVNGWVFAEMGNTRGWVFRQGGKVDFTSVNAPNPPPIPHDDLPELPTVTPVGQFTLTKLPGTWVNVRAYPDATLGADIGDLHKGDAVTLYTPEVDGWVFAEMGDMRGWVWRQNGKVDFTAAAGTAAASAAHAASQHGAAAALAAVRSLIMPESVSRTPNFNNNSGPSVITSGSGKDTSSADDNGSAIVPFDDNPYSQMGFANTKEDLIRLRDAFQQVEEGARRIRTELERLISRRRD